MIVDQVELNLQVTSMSNNTMVKLTKPVEPNKEDCCNSGCNPCIFEIYEKQLKMYEKHLDDGKYLQSKENGILQMEYTQFIVIKNLNLCSMHNLIAFRRQSPDCVRVWWKPGDHFLYKFISSDISCTRAYTPVKINKKNVIKEEYDFLIIVKRYENGVVSNHLCNQHEGSITLWRGPYGHYTIEPNKFHRIIMIAQGTGITTFITIINNILNDEDDMTKITLIYCCKSLHTTLFRDELYAYKSYWNFIYEIYLREPSLSIDIKYQEPINSNKLKCEDLIKLKPFTNNDQFLICGSKEFIKDYDNYLRSEFFSADNIVLF